MSLQSNTPGRITKDGEPGTEADDRGKDGATGRQVGNREGQTDGQVRLTGRGRREFQDGRDLIR